MKRRISDLLEGIREDTVELNTQTPLASNRIKELTMSKINSEKKTHTITNKLCKSMNSEYIGVECSLDEVPEWSGLAEIG